MFMVNEADAAAIREAFEQGGELAAAAEFRRRFPGITDNEKAREFALTILGWHSTDAPPAPTKTRKGRRPG